MPQRLTRTERIEHPRSHWMHDNFISARGGSSSGGSKMSLKQNTKLNIRFILPFLIVIGFTLLLLLIPLSRSDAQATEWTPVWVDLNNSGVIHTLGLDVDRSQAKKPSISPAAQTPEESGIGDAIRQFLSSMHQTFPSLKNQLAGWTTIFSDDFEAAFPGDWNVFDSDDSNNGEYYWAKADCRSYSGDYSAWVVGGGADGSGLNCGNEYLINSNSWMIYGPFSLEEAADAEFIFMYWLNSEPDYDNFFVGASLDNSIFYGEMTSGSQDWTEENFDLTDVFTLGNLTGEQEVWVGIGFWSDSSVNYPEGAYVDNVEIRQYLQGEPTEPPPAQDILCFLPMVERRLPIPAAPVLNAISNTDGDGNYNVSWSSSAGATTYTLEEDENIGFSSPSAVYSGSSTSKAISGKGIGTYYYRVKASNSSGSSGWSNIVSAVVTLPPPACPQAGEWSGTTSQGVSIGFTVENSPQCQVTSLGLYAQNCFPGEDYFISVSWPGGEFPVINGSFTTGPGSDQVTGNFSSVTTAEGTFSVKFTKFDLYLRECYSTGTWTAHP
jgi:hypothetical protein